MYITAYKTKILLPPKDNLYLALTESITVIKENSIVAVTSKVVSIHEGCCIPIKNKTRKKDIVKTQADKYLPGNMNKYRTHTIKNGILIGSAGVDKSNAKGHYILWPDKPYISARNLWKFLRTRYKVRNLGVIITDSTSSPLKRGVIGITIAYWGFYAVNNYAGKPDLFGRKQKCLLSNMADSLAAIAVTMMGETSEQTPVVIIEDIPRIKFWQKNPHTGKWFSSFHVPVNEDMFAPFLNALPWKTGESG